MGGISAHTSTEASLGERLAVEQTVLPNVHRCPKGVSFQAKHLKTVRSFSNTSQNMDSLAMLCCPESFAFPQDVVTIIFSAHSKVVMVKDGRARGRLALKESQMMPFPLKENIFHFNFVFCFFFSLMKIPRSFALDSV